MAIATNWSNPSKINTTWSSVSVNNTNWRIDYTEGRHTYGAEYNKTTRIVYGDNVRYGGIANLSSGISTSWT